MVYTTAPWYSIPVQKYDQMGYPLIHPSIHPAFCPIYKPLNVFNIINTKIWTLLEMHFILEVLHVFFKINEFGFSKLSVRLEIDLNQR